METMPLFGEGEREGGTSEEDLWSELDQVLESTPKEETVVIGVDMNE